jgi:uracil-DNA glycosylase family 4
MMRLSRINKLYKKIHTCRKCFNAPGCKLEFDNQRVKRKIIDRALNSEVFIIGESLGKTTQRLSGLPYISVNGQLSRTGQALNDFLIAFGYAIYPTSSKRDVYSSDTIQCCLGGRKPTFKEIENCSVWLDQELEVIHPKVVILLGRIAAQSFLKRHLKFNAKMIRSFRGKRVEFNKWGETSWLFCVPHPAYKRRNPLEVEGIYRQAASQISEIVRYGKSKGTRAEDRGDDRT